ncbi:MAG TPA: twin-arginine translocase subunit TatC [Solirubrobacteraceae bacterium]|nr:twin-arginine translocase subunit TatC [Solirubrobacteraceae bacterium]
MGIRALIRRLRAAGHGETMSLVAHLDELRTRIIVSLLALGVAFGLCFWQNARLLSLIDRPLSQQTQAQVRAGDGPLGATYEVQRSARDIALSLQTVVAATARAKPPLLSPAALGDLTRSLSADVRRLSAAPRGDRPVTLGIGEPFTTTVTVSLVLALILAAPVLLWQAWAFIAPALEPSVRRRVRPLLPAVPALFVAGVAFGYLAVLPAAVRFFENFNSSRFNVLVQAAPYYRFAAMTLLAMGVIFELPIAILAVTRAGVVSVARLRRSRRWAVGACAAVAALLPGDAVTMLLETVPLYLLFELSLLIAAIADRRAATPVGAPEPAPGS